MDAGKRTINDIFNGNRALEIPFFQRSYVWKESQWKRLLNDLESVSERNRQYFLGSIILKQKTTNSDDTVGDRRTIIDGQQRLTTLSIFFQAWGILSESEKLLNICRLRMDDNQIAIEHNYNDIEAYIQVLNHKENKLIEGEGQIVSAFNYFLTNISPEKLNLQVILKNIILIGIDLIADEDEQQIFDTINTLGIKLGASEKLKNYLFKKNEVVEYEKYWRLPFENDNKIKKYWDQEVNAGRIKRPIIDLFLNAYLQIKLQDKRYGLTTKEKSEFGKFDDLFASFTQFIDRTGITITELREEIFEYAKIFKVNFDPSKVSEQIPAESGMHRTNTLIFGLENSTLIPFVLYVLKHQQDTVQRNELLGYVETYIMRRMIAKDITKNYNNIFSEQLIGNQVLTKADLHDLLINKADRSDSIPGNTKLKYAFHNSELTNKQAAGILYFMETKIRNQKKHNSPLYGLSRYTLEHIMPKKWRNHWGTTEDEKLRDHHLLTLGNLTILTSTLNTSLKDSTWQDKVNGKGSKGGMKLYSDGLQTIHEYLKLPNWDENSIEIRARQLFYAATKIWEVDGEKVFENEFDASAYIKSIQDTTDSQPAS